MFKRCIKHKDILKISYELSFTRTTLSCTRTVVPVVRDAVIRDNRINYIILNFIKFNLINTNLLIN